MTLHEAIVQLLQQKGRPMSTSEIATALNQNGWYKKKDGSAISGFQIHGRTRNYAHLFHREGSMVSLHGSGTQPPKVTRTARPVVQTSPLPTSSRQVQDLLREKDFKEAGDIDQLVPDQPGLYCIRIRNTRALPQPFNTFLSERNHDILYIGIASQSLKKRFLHQELRARGHGSFFRSIGAVLGYKPEKGSLLTKKNKRNYQFHPNDEAAIIQWINQNLQVNWVTTADQLEDWEGKLIEQHLPLLNLSKNPAALPTLKALREECVRLANSLV